MLIALFNNLSFNNKTDMSLTGAIHNNKLGSEAQYYSEMKWHTI